MKKKTFEQWFAEVDAKVKAEVGCPANDLPDCCYADWYEEGYSPTRAARKAIKSAGDY